ncbi:MAG TPA: spore coat protein, partial [Bacteroidetes bacterium]|nr:spore coat protein [Bacteroidota bacterium]
MKGIVLAGGTGSRLFPLTKVTNKHLLPVGDMPMIYYPIKKLIGAGMEEILIVTGTDHMGDVVSLLGSGKDFGCRFTYKVQDEAGGIAQALGLAENFAGGDPGAVILGDNIFKMGLQQAVANYPGSGSQIMVK